MVDTIKFSEMQSGGDLSTNDKTPGLLNGDNVLFNNPAPNLAAGTTADRPAIAPAMYYRLRFNTELESFEYYAPTLGWTQLEDSEDGANAPFVVYQDAPNLTNSFNLGALNSGVLRQTVSGGVATPSIAINGVDYYAPGFTGFMSAPAGFLDNLGNETLGLNGVSDAVNYLSFSNSVTGSNPLLSSLGDDTDIGARFLAKGAGVFEFVTENSQAFSFITGSGTNRTTNFNFAAGAGAFDLTFPSISGTLALTSDIPADYVESVTGTANQVLVNNTTGTAQTGVLTLTLPQSIDPTNSPTFNNLTLTGGFIRDINSNTVLQLSSLSSAVNYIALQNSPTGVGLLIDARGLDDDIPIALSSKGSSTVSFQSRAPLYQFQYFTGTGATHLTQFNFPTSSGVTRQISWPDKGGVVAFIDDIPASGGTVNSAAANSIAYYPSSGTAVSGITTTNRAMLVTNTSGVPSMTSSMTNGQVVIGSTGGAPAPATLTAGTGISITPGSNSITISSSSTGTVWVENTTTPVSMNNNTGYIANAGATQVVYTLPLTSAVGAILHLVAKGAGGFRVNQNTGQNIRIGTITTSTGTPGYITSTDIYDSLTLVCITADTTWVALNGAQSSGIGIF